MPTITQHAIERLHALGLELPASPPRPGGSYVPVRVRGGLAFVACQFPFKDGTPAFRGRLGAELSTADGVAAARLAALNALAQLHHNVGLDRLEGLCRFEMYLQCGPGWDEMPAVLDGASRLFLDVLGEELGSHSRAPIGVAQLPLNLPVELVLTAAVRA